MLSKLIKNMFIWIGILGVFAGVLAVVVFGYATLITYANSSTYNFISAVLLTVAIGGAIIGAMKYYLDEKFPDPKVK